MALGQSLLTFQKKTYFSTGTPTQNSLWILIQGIWEKYPRQALTILRERIYSTETLSPGNQGIIKIAAKRVSADLAIHDLQNLLEKCTSKEEIIYKNNYRAPEEFKKYFLAPLSLPEITNFLRKLSTYSPRAPQRYQQDRSVGAILIDKNQQLLAYAHNTNHQNKTLHAEVNLIQSFGRNPLPEGSRIITSLEPCKMCAGIIADISKNLKNFKLEYLDCDPGTATRQSWISTHRISHTGG